MDSMIPLFMGPDDAPLKSGVLVGRIILSRRERSEDWWRHQDDPK